MAGKIGMKRPSSAQVARRKVWQSMRIMRRFTIADLCRTSGAENNNVLRFLHGLQKHGYVASFGQYISGRAGSYKSWRLMRDTGPDHPVRCDRCGNALQKPCKKDES